MLTLDVEEDGLLAGAVVVLGADDVLAAVIQLHAVDDEGVVFAGVSLHVLDRLAELHVVVEPAHRRHSDAYDAARELDALSLVSEGVLWSDNEARSTLSAVWGRKRRGVEKWPAL